jgi:hypothetical protein
MKLRPFLLGTVLVSPLAAAAAPQALRTIDCNGTYTDAAGAPQNITLSFTDYSVDDPDFPGEKQFLGEAEVQAAFLPMRPAMMKTEQRNHDLETERDGDPNERDGWGGTAFYGLLLKGTEEDPQEGLALVTQSLREQIGQRIRQYQFAAAHIADDPSHPGGNPIETVVADKGLLNCRLR